MKVLAVALLVLGMLCESMLAMAEGPVPFRALMTTAGAPPSVSAGDAQDNSTAPPAKPAHPSQMTSGGKAMIGVGIGLLASGGVVIAGTAALGNWASSKRGALYGGGAGLAATGTILIVLGTHRRSAQ